MKHYLVAFEDGGDKIKSEQIDVENDYIPYKDNLLLIRKKIVEEYKPHYYSKYVSPPECGNYIGFSTGSAIKAEDLKIIAISSLD